MQNLPHDERETDKVVGLGIVDIDADQDSAPTVSNVHFSSQASELDSPHSQALDRQLRHATEALEQLRRQVIDSRERRQSRRIVNSHRPTHVSPELRTVSDRTRDEKQNSISQTLHQEFGKEEVTFPRVKQLVRRHESMMNLAQDRINCEKWKDQLASASLRSPAMTSSPHVQWTTTSPALPSSVQSTPRIASTPTLTTSSQWMASPSVTSNSASFQSSYSNPSSASTDFSANAPHQTATKSDGTQQRSHETADKNVALASGIAGGVAGSLLLVLLILWALCFRRRRQRRCKELSNVLDKVAPSLQPSSSRGSHSLDEVHKDTDVAGTANHVGTIRPGSVASPPTVEVRMVPALDVPQVQHTVSDLEANERHSYELVQSGIIRQGVNRDMSFTWMFPKLSVPPAAARNLTPSHYVKKRSTMPSERSSSTLGTNSSASPTASLSASISGLNRSNDRSTEASSGCVNDWTGQLATTDSSTQSGAASSEFVDPQVDHGQRSFVADGTPIRTRWWNSSLRGYSAEPYRSQDGQHGRSVSSPPAPVAQAWFTSSRRPSQNSVVQREAHTALAISSHDPVMQEVMQRILCMPHIGPTEPDHTSRTLMAENSRTDLQDDGEKSLEYYQRRVASLPTLASYNKKAAARQASLMGNVLETCREDSEESVQMSRDLRSASGRQRMAVHAGRGDVRPIYSYFEDDDNDEHIDDDDIIQETEGTGVTSKEEGTNGPVKDHATLGTRKSSIAYSSYSIVIHEAGEDETFNSEDWVSSGHAIPASPDLRRSEAPKILLTSTEEDGRHERHISITSVESTSVQSESSGGHSTTSSRSSYPDGTSDVHADVASAVGQAFFDQMQQERRDPFRQTRSSIDKMRFNRDSESTLDSLVAYSRTTNGLDTDSLIDVAFDEAFTEAADALNDLTGDRPASFTPSETGTACLVDDDFPTIPTWKPMPINSPWRSTSNASLATVRQ